MNNLPVCEFIIKSEPIPNAIPEKQSTPIEAIKTSEYLSRHLSHFMRLNTLKAVCPLKSVRLLTPFGVQ